MILVTGSAGKTGRALLRALSARGEEARALVHRPEQARLVTEAGAQDVVVGDMRDPKTMEQATEKVRAVYHIPPNVHPDEITIGMRVIDGAFAARSNALLLPFCAAPPD